MQRTPTRPSHLSRQTASRAYRRLSNRSATIQSDRMVRFPGRRPERPTRRRAGTGLGAPRPPALCLERGLLRRRSAPHLPDGVLARPQRASAGGVGDDNDRRPAPRRCFEFARPAVSNRPARVGPVLTKCERSFPPSTSKRRRRWTFWQW